MPLPDDFFDEGVNYRIRLCMRVDESPYVTAGSKIHMCDSCGEPIWVAEGQPIPDPPEGIVIAGDVNLCRLCSSMAFAAADDPSDIQNIDTVPEEFRNQARKYFGLPPT